MPEQEVITELRQYVDTMAQYANDLLSLYDIQEAAHTMALLMFKLAERARVPLSPKYQEVMVEKIIAWSEQRKPQKDEMRRDAIVRERNRVANIGDKTPMYRKIELSIPPEELAGFLLENSDKFKERNICMAIEHFVNGDSYTALGERFGITKTRVHQVLASTVQKINVLRKQSK